MDERGDRLAVVHRGLGAHDAEPDVARGDPGALERAARGAHGERHGVLVHGGIEMRVVPRPSMYFDGSTLRARASDASSRVSGGRARPMASIPACIRLTVAR